MPAFQNQAVIVTGASSGIGRALALQLAGQGARLALAARDQARLEETAQACRQADPAGGEALVVPTNVTDQVQCQALVERTSRAFGQIDMLVNNAGVSQFAYFEEIRDLSIFEQLMHINYLSAVYLTYFAWPHIKRSRGRIVAVSSLAGLSGIPSRTGYSASKHALGGFYDALRAETPDSGVSITLAYPGFVTSEMRLRAFGPDGRPLGSSTVQESEVMSAEECARLILQAAEKRQRELVMTARGRLGRWIKLFAPGLVDRMARKAIREGK